MCLIGLKLWTIHGISFFCQDESLFASPKKTIPGEEDAFATALSERSSRRRSGKLMWSDTVFHIRFSLMEKSACGNVIFQ